MTVTFQQAPSNGCSPFGVITLITGGFLVAT